jgi:hypothetical protein
MDAGKMVPTEKVLGECARSGIMAAVLHWQCCKHWLCSPGSSGVWCWCCSIAVLAVLGQAEVVLVYAWHNSTDSFSCTEGMHNGSAVVFKHDSILLASGALPKQCLWSVDIPVCCYSFTYTTRSNDTLFLQISWSKQLTRQTNPSSWWMAFPALKTRLQLSRSG